MLCFSPTTPLQAAGIRVEPPPSVATASGAIPLATATAAPPLEPPAQRSARQALRVRPNSGEFGQALAAELRRRGLADQDRAGGAEPGDRDRIMVRHVVLVRHRAKRGAHALGVDDVLDRERDTVERPERLARHHLAFRLARPGHGLVAAQRDEAVQLALQPLGARKNRARRLDGRDILAGDARAKLDGREMTEILAHSVDNARMNSVSGVYNESRPRGAPS